MAEDAGVAVDVVRDLDLSDALAHQLGVLWGKSAKYGGGLPNLLLSHLLDTAAVAGLMWDGYLSPSLRDALDQLAGGDGRRFFMWACGIHDCGKATPAFQAVDDVGAARVRAAGLTWRSSALRNRRWRHDKAGGKVLRDVLGGVWEAEAVEWVWPLVAGHHGSFPSSAVFGRRSLSRLVEHQGRGAPWRAVQAAVVEVFTQCLGYQSVADVQPVQVPTKAVQLSLSGLIVMADWVASDSREGRFPGIDRLEDVSMRGARERAERAWSQLKLRGGWDRLPEPPARDLVRARFGDVARASQQQLVDVVRGMPGPGLVFVEAPMGEGKTKAALAAAEVLASRFGAGGVYVGMPTQATCDPMFSTVREWVSQFGAGLPDDVALLHGKKMFNPQWREMWQPSGNGEPDLYGTVGEDGVDEYGMGPGCCGGAAGDDGPSSWYLGRHRGLLSPFVVGTIDQLLFAAARTKHVMLRFAGLAGKVVILDEVHAADVYMRQFLFEGLRWLGQAGVPVLLLSATLPPAQRRALAGAYLEGAAGLTGVEVSTMPEPAGYPSVSAVCWSGGEPHFATVSSDPWRASQPVQLRWLPDISEDGQAVAAAVQREVADGGVALVVLNTVARAQNIYRQLAAVFPGETLLLHGRLCAADRAERTERCLRDLGAGGDRPGRLVVVATQLAEQSFDVDADLLVTDLAPVDLLLQRIGRLHRHADTRRPEHLQAPRVLVTGTAAGAPAPEFLPASQSIYGRYLLLRTAAVLAREAGEPGQSEEVGAVWSVPAQVPRLVAELYGDGLVCPPEWGDGEEQARLEWEKELQGRADKARGRVLTREGEWASRTLEGLHEDGTGFAREEELRALVRDGEESAEVIVVRRDERGYLALDGTRLGVLGEASEQVRDAVLGGTTRLPAKPALTKAMEAECGPLPGWGQVPWLAYAKALLLDDSGCAEVGDFRLGYDQVLGLIVEGR